jgi:hypothetical protein
MMNHKLSIEITVVSQNMIHITNHHDNYHHAIYNISIYIMYIICIYVIACWSMYHKYDLKVSPFINVYHLKKWGISPYIALTYIGLNKNWSLTSDFCRSLLQDLCNHSIRVVVGSADFGQELGVTCWPQ